MFINLIPTQFRPKNSLANNKTNKLTSLLINIGVGASLVTVATMPLVATAAEITPSTAKYKISVDNTYNGTATRRLSKSGNNWNFKVSATISQIAKADQSSSFKINGTTVSPISASTSYGFLFRGGNKHDFRFNPASKKVVSTYQGKTNSYTAPNGALDDLALEVQIRQDLLNGNFPGNYYTAKKDKAEKISFKKVGTYNVTVPAGTYDTVRIDRVHGDNSRSTSFWLAPSLDYLPVKMTQLTDGKNIQMQLTQIQ